MPIAIMRTCVWRISWKSWQKPIHHRPAVWRASMRRLPMHDRVTDHGGELGAPPHTGRGHAWLSTPKLPENGDSRFLFPNYSLPDSSSGISTLRRKRENKTWQDEQTRDREFVMPSSFAWSRRQGMVCRATGRPCCHLYVQAVGGVRSLHYTSRRPEMRDACFPISLFHSSASSI
jgi:hypothetical protein